MDYGLKLKLIVDPKKNKVVFAKAGKAFFDMLFKLLKLPMGSFVYLHRKNQIEMMGCLVNLFNTLITSNHLDSDQSKSVLTVIISDATSISSFLSRLELVERLETSKSYVRDWLYVVTNDLKVIENTVSNCMQSMAADKRFVLSSKIYIHTHTTDTIKGREWRIGDTARFQFPRCV